jgi:hypothetical protein
MISDLINKIDRKSKEVKFKASKNYKSNGRSNPVPYEEVIVLSEMFPDNIFLVHKNLIFERNSIGDSSYEVFSFDREGNFLEQKENLGKDFFRTMKVVKKL